jgi:hypothetical protein
MKSSSFPKERFYYFVLFLIILIGIFAFYLSCKSKSPTEATSALHNQVFAQSTNNTTTSSSTTTTSRPGSSPANTTTLITSRTLTTTSTTTTSTSTTTTSIRPTTTSSVHSTCATAKMELVEVKVNGTPVADGGTFTVHPGDELKIVTKFCNNGTGTSQFCQFGLGYAGCVNFIKYKLPWDVPVSPGSCTTGFIKVSISAGCSLNSSIISIIWGYCDSKGNHCNKGPIFYTINLNIVPSE